MQGKPNNKEVEIPLRIMRQYLHEIVKGTKKTEYRQLNKYYVELFMFTDKKGDPIDFRNIVRLKLYVGNEKNGEYAVVEVLQKGNIENPNNDETLEYEDMDFYFDIGKIIETNVSL